MFTKTRCIAQFTFLVLFLLSAVSTWTMEHHQVAAPWTRWPVQDRASSCRPTLSTASGGSRSCTAQTATTTSLPSPCPETPPSPVTCECFRPFFFLFVYLFVFKPTPFSPVALKALNSIFRPCLSECVSECHSWMFISIGHKAATRATFGSGGKCA